VIHCKTNVPQTLMALDSVSNVFGRTLTSENRQEWTEGGSSGGGGILVKMRGSVMGVGMDVGGSIRIPAACNGTIGFKPSLGRVPAGGKESGQLRVRLGWLGWNRVLVILLVVSMMWRCLWRRLKRRRCGRLMLRLCRGGGGVGVMAALGEHRGEGRLAKEVDVVDADAKRFNDCQGRANKFFGVEGGNHMLIIIESKANLSSHGWRHD